MRFAVIGLVVAACALTIPGSSDAEGPEEVNKSLYEWHVRPLTGLDTVIVSVHVDDCLTKSLDFDVRDEVESRLRSAGLVPLRRVIAPIVWIEATARVNPDSGTLYSIRCELHDWVHMYRIGESDFKCVYRTTSFFGLADSASLETAIESALTGSIDSFLSDWTAANATDGDR